MSTKKPTQPTEPAIVFEEGGDEVFPTTYDDETDYEQRLRSRLGRENRSLDRKLKSLESLLKRPEHRKPSPK